MIINHVDIILSLNDCMYVFWKVPVQRRAAERTDVQEEQKFKVVAFFIFVSPLGKELKVVTVAFLSLYHHCWAIRFQYQERLEENNEAAEERTRKRR